MNPPAFPFEPCIPLSNLPILIYDQKNQVLYNFMKKLRTYFYTVILQCIFVYCINDITTMFKDVHGNQDLMKRCSHLGVLASASTAEQSQI